MSYATIRVIPNETPLEGVDFTPTLSSIDAAIDGPKTPDGQNVVRLHVSLLFD